MLEFYIRYSGIGSCSSSNLEKIWADDLDAANIEAYDLAKEDWFNYEGLHGNYDIAQIMEEEGCDEEEALEIQQENIEWGIDYEVYSKDALAEELAKVEEFLDGNPISRFYNSERERIVDLLEEINEYD